MIKDINEVYLRYLTEVDEFFGMSNLWKGQEKVMSNNEIDAVFVDDWFADVDVYDFTAYLAVDTEANE